MINIHECLEDFMDYLEGVRKSENTIKSYKSDIIFFVKFVKDKKDTVIISESDFKKLSFNYLDKLRYYDNNSEYAISTLNRKRSSIRKFVSFLYKREYISSNFSDKIEVIKDNSNAKKDILDNSELALINSYLNQAIVNSKDIVSKYRAYRNKFIFLTFIYTGVRVSELINIKWTHIDLGSNIIFIKNGKGNKSRAIPINPSFKTEILNYQNILSELFAGNKDLFNGYIFFRDERSFDIPLTQKTIRKIIASIANKSGIVYKHITPHSLRHTFASHSIKGQMSITTLSDILGHAKTSITLDIYAHIINEQQKQSEMEKLTYNL